MTSLRPFQNVHQAMNTLTGAGLAFALALSSWAAEEPRVEPGQGDVADQVEEEPDQAEDAVPEGNVKLGKIRFWNFSTIPNQSVAVYLTKGGDFRAADSESAIWLARGSRTSEIREYVSVPEGDYQLLLLEEDATDFTVEDLAELRPKLVEAKPLIEPEPIKIEEGAHLTAMLIPDGGNNVLRIWNDVKDIPAGSVRVAKFIDRSPVTFATLNGDDLSPIETPTEIGVQVVRPDVDPNLQVFALVFETDKGVQSRRTVEVTTKPWRSISLIAHPDRYGRVAFRAVGDAPTGVSE